MKPIFLLFTALLIGNLAQAQKKTLDGVYAGIQVSLSVTMGGGMNRTDNTYLFRPDGTFNDQMNKPDWKTRVSGHYDISGQNITLHYSGKNNISKFKFDKNGGDDLDAGGYYLLHMDDNNHIPQGFFEFHFMSSSGGGSSGMVYVGAASDKSLYFDGKGHFSNTNENATVVSGESVGGGGSSKSGGQGTYQIKDGILLLTFNNGKTETHTFFCRPREKPIMAVIDGNIFFMKDDKEDAKTAKSVSKSPAAGTAKTPVTDNATNTGNTDGKAILLKANAVHGGSSLDNIKTVHVSATVQGIQLTTYIDVTGNRMRVEARQGQKLVLVDQLDNQDSWHWQNGRLGQLPAARVAEMKASFNSGIMGLRKSVIDRMQIQKTQVVNGGKYSIIGKLDGIGYIFMINEQNQLIGEGSQEGQNMSVSVLSDYRQVGGILMPFHEIETTGRQKLIIQYTDLQLNQPIDEATWSKPNGS